MENLSYTNNLNEPILTFSCTTPLPTSAPREGRRERERWCCWKCIDVGFVGGNYRRISVFVSTLVISLFFEFIPFKGKLFKRTKRERERGVKVAGAFVRSGYWESLSFLIASHISCSAPNQPHFLTRTNQTRKSWANIIFLLVWVYISLKKEKGRLCEDSLFHFTRSSPFQFPLISTIVASNGAILSLSDGFIRAYVYIRTYLHIISLPSHLLILQTFSCSISWNSFEQNISTSCSVYTIYSYIFTNVLGAWDSKFKIVTYPNRQVFFLMRNICTVRIIQKISLFVGNKW